ncbi:hypothetical protein IU514_03705 [Lysobacter niastensis]|uniref:Uncharacterized protein n=2 Tax=Lysobacter niastensis TaxID=380629 RepID=A0ABS0B3T4_9GAMM|nr:hypothetical protein [Lysobacter niastensis]
MGTITNLFDWLSRRSSARPAIVLTAIGFSAGDGHVAWQSVAEIWGCKADRCTTDEAFLEFVAAGQRITISEEQPGFEVFERAMIAAFPATAAWRDAVLMPPFAANRTLLYRRG